MTAKEKTLWEQAVQVLRRNIVTISVEPLGQSRCLRRLVSRVPRGGGGLSFLSRTRFSAYSAYSDLQ